jgi:hypothetical protein
MKTFNEFAYNKLLKDFRSYLEHEYRLHPRELQNFVSYLNEQGQQPPPLPTQRFKPKPPREGVPNVYPVQQGQQVQQPAQGQQPVQAQQGQQVQQPAQGQQPVQQAQRLPVAQPVQQGQQAQQPAQPANNGTGSAFVGQAIDKLMPNILKTAQQKNPNNYPQVQQLVQNFQNQWKQFKQQIPQLLGPQGVKNPQKHGLTYGFQQ